MPRKSKQPGGHNPLTSHERKKYCGQYGTATARLGTNSQKRFGDYCLTTQPAVDPVVTPSGNIYSREAIVSYLLTKTQEMKELRAKRVAVEAAKLQRQSEAMAEEHRKAVAEFARKDQGAAQADKSQHSKQHDENLGKKISIETASEGRKGLKRTSYWLADSSPETPSTEISTAASEPIPNRPASPTTGRPIRRKELVSVTFNREEGKRGKVTCAVSAKAISFQNAVVIKKTGQVMLLDVYEKLAKPTMTCPVTGRKFKEKDVIRLQKAASGFAASGDIVAKKYRPTMT